jgi:CheY-like chemotaxis protein
MKPKRVLLVDDNQDFLKAAKRFLRTVPGLELVGQATSGEQALELTAALHPDLVLMDFAMPGMNGPAATLRIKQQPNAPKVIILTHL